MKKCDPTIKVDVVVAGKLRRYQHLTVLQHVTIPSIFFSNIRDGFKVAFGFMQALVKLLFWRPDVVFTKGGYVCLPVGWAASFLRIPLVIHDSDAHPGLTNRLLAKSAQIIATGAPLKYYSYPAAKAVYVGIPISNNFKAFSSEARRQLKQDLGYSGDRPLVVVTGGGLGARRLNDAIVNNRSELTKIADVYLISGVHQYDELRERVGEDSDAFTLHAFVSSGMAPVVGAADVVVARAGATTIVELAAVAAPTVLVPNAQLTGGHQVKNAAVYADANAALVVDEMKFEDNPSELINPIRRIVENTELRNQLSRNIATFAKPDAALHMAQLILKAVKNKA